MKEMVRAAVTERERENGRNEMHMRELGEERKKKKGRRTDSAL
jgi:hypothetical protein